MKFYEAIDWYISDMRSQGRLNSDSSERGYRSTLEAHAAMSAIVIPPRPVART